MAEGIIAGDFGIYLGAAGAAADLLGARQQVRCGRI